MDKFIGMAQKNREYITLEEFSDCLGIPETDRIRDMFELYHRVIVWLLLDNVKVGFICMTAHLVIFGYVYVFIIVPEIFL